LKERRRFRISLFFPGKNGAKERPRGIPEKNLPLILGGGGKKYEVSETEEKGRRGNFYPSLIWKRGQEPPEWEKRGSLLPLS